MKTLEEIKGRCKIEPGDKPGEEHWLWQGAMRTRRGHGARTPCVWAPDYTHDRDGVMRVQSVPRAIVHIETKKPIPAGKFPFRVCTHDRCVNPSCYTKLMTMEEWGRFASRRKLLLERCDYSELNLRSWETRGRKWDSDTVREIALSGLTGRALEEKFGIDANYANTIKRGDARRSDYRQAMGPFGGLLR